MIHSLLQTTIMIISQNILHIFQNLDLPAKAPTAPALAEAADLPSVLEALFVCGPDVGDHPQWQDRTTQLDHTHCVLVARQIVQYIGIQAAATAHSKVCVTIIA